MLLIQFGLHHRIYVEDCTSPNDCRQGRAIYYGISGGADIASKGTSSGTMKGLPLILVAAQAAGAAF